MQCEVLALAVLSVGYGLRWRIEFKVFQSVRGLEDDSVTRFVRKLDLIGFRN